MQRCSTRHEMSDRELLFVVCAVVLFLSLFIIGRWLISWRMDRSVEKFIREVKEGKHRDLQSPPREYSLEITFDTAGFQLASLKQTDQKPIFISWNEITRITAFKRDLFTVDCICLMINTADSKELELNEDMKGWSEFTESIEKFLSGSRPFSEWFFQVAHPAFETNPTEIFSKL